MQRTHLQLTSIALALGAGALVVVASYDDAESASATCPVTSSPTTWSGSFLDTDTTKNGTIFGQTAGGRIEVSRNAESFSLKQLSGTSTTVFGAVADFNKDGWPDIASAGLANSCSPCTNRKIDILENQTWENENCTDATCTTHSGTACTVCAPNSPPDFLDPAVVITPKFTNVRQLGSYPEASRTALAAADFNGDGWPDVFAANAPVDSDFYIDNMDLYLNTGTNDASGHPQFNAGYAANAFSPITGTVRELSASGTVIKAYDYNNDGRMDILLATGRGKGSIRILLNNCPGTMQANGVVLCSSNPQFTDGGALVSGLKGKVSDEGYGDQAVFGQNPQFDYGDIDGDGLPDLVVGAINCCSTATNRMKIFKGCPGGGGCTNGLEDNPSQSVAFSGAATAVMLADFSGDGKLDLVLATDGSSAAFNNSVNGGTSFYYRNNGTSAPFSGGVTQQITNKGSSPPTTVNDYDIGLVIDYDRDPTGTPDYMVADGNTTTSYQMIANRLAASFVDCGEVESGVIDLGALATEEIVVTAARLSPTVTLNGGTITYFMSNEDPENYVQASPCTVAPTSDFCVSFPKPVGSKVRWKAELCSNTPAHNTTPQLFSVDLKFDYTKAAEHYRAGTIVNDGIVYLGAFQEPGDRGRFYAINAGFASGSPQIYWDAADKIQSMADGNRKIYTTAANLSVRLDFDVANASNLLLQNVLQTADTTATADLITWVRSSRFGTGTGSSPLQRMGGVETSTPAILTKPGRPGYYTFATATDRSRIDTFISARATRRPLVLVGAKDGMLHAFHTRPDDISNTINGSEAWAFIPPTVAAGMNADRTATLAKNAALGGNNPTIASYPDGSPTLADVHVGNGVFKSLAIIGEANGGKSITTLDVTETIDQSTDAVLGPTAMWSATPGDSDAGLAFSKPAVARVLVNNAERFFVISATGIDFTDVAGLRGRVVSAYDALTGQLMWKFEAKCPVTTDITTFETDDIAEPGAPTLNGFMDRVVFADKCGNVYKLDPAVDLAGEFYENTGMGSILANTTVDGKKQFALFSTASTTGAIGADRPIGGTLAARTDSSTRMVLFFGTGGLEQFAANQINEFYAVYADTGEIRSKLTGACVASGCEKFYGGVLVTPEIVVFTKTVDPVIGTGTCDLGKTTLSTVQLNPDGAGDFVSVNDNATFTATMGGIFGDANAIYFATLSGEVVRVGTPRAANAGDDSTNGVGQQTGIGDNATGSGGPTGTTEPFTLLSWRVVL